VNAEMVEAQEVEELINQTQLPKMHPTFQQSRT